MAKKAVDFKNGLFHVPDLIEAARLKAGVDDASVLETPGLVALAGALTNSSDDLHFIGRGRAQRMLLETLVKRLRVERYLNNVPEIRQIPIERPVFIVAPFRAGTTLMHRLLAQDPAHRTPRLWETLQAPPAEPEYRGDSLYFERDFRVAAARKYMDARERYTPLLAAIHPTAPNEPEECFGLLETSLLSHSFMFYAPVEDYLLWLDDRTEDEWKAAYSLYADQLRLLQWWWPGDRWLLKTGYHMWGLEAILATFPDAFVVQLHRKPVEIVSSFCSLMEQAYAPISPQVDRDQIGRIALHYFSGAVARNVAARERLDSAQFLDIDYRDLVDDPLECARSVYGAAGLEWDANVEQRMSTWLKVQASERQGVAKHSYSLDDYGLDEDEVEAAFAEYSKYNTGTVIV